MKKIISILILALAFWLISEDLYIGFKGGDSAFFDAWAIIINKQ